MLSYIEAALIYIPVNSVQGFHFFHTLANTCYFFSTIIILTGVRWYLTVILISISLMNTFMHLHILSWKWPIQVICLFFDLVIKLTSSHSLLSRCQGVGLNLQSSNHVVDSPGNQLCILRGFIKVTLLTQ